MESINVKEKFIAFNGNYYNFILTPRHCIFYSQLMKVMWLYVSRCCAWRYRFIHAIFYHLTCSCILLWELQILIFHFLQSEGLIQWLTDFPPQSSWFMILCDTVTFLTLMGTSLFLKYPIYTSLNTPLNCLTWDLSFPRVLMSSVICIMYPQLLSYVSACCCWKTLMPVPSNNCAACSSREWVLS